MTDTAWLVLAICAGVVFAVGWLKREQWIRRRRANRND